MSKDDEFGPERSRGNFVVVLEVGAGNRTMFIGDDGEACRFPTAQAARDMAVGRMWEHAWVWWIVELTDGGSVVYGQDIEPSKGKS